MIKSNLEFPFSSIASLHRICLPNDILSILGEKVLNKFYHFCILKNNCSYSIYFVDGNPLGICLFSKKFSLAKFVKENFFLITCSSLRNIVLKPKNVFIFVDIVRLLIRFPSKLPEWELLYIFVDKSLRGRSIGRQLIKESLPGAPSWVKTLSSTQENVLFYEKNGYKVECKVEGRTFLVKR